MKIEVYKTRCSVGSNQFSFVVDDNIDHYYYIYSRDECIHISGGRWRETLASQRASESSWLEVLIITGRSRAELEKEIKDHPLPFITHNE